MDMNNGRKFNNEHIGAAFRIISSLNVSGDTVDAVCAIRQQLMMADRDFAKNAEPVLEKIEPLPDAAEDKEG